MTDEYREKRIAEIIDQIAEGHGRLSDQYRDDPVLPEALIRILSDENSDSGLLNDALQCTYNLGKPAIRPLVLALENRRMYPGGEALTRCLFRALTDPSQADDVVAVVIDELVLRQSGRPEEHFSSAVVAQVLEKAIEYNPRLHRRILSDLCTLAYEHDDGVRDRAVALARRLGADEFASLVKAQTEENPTAAAAIMHILGGSEATAFFAELQSQALERFRAPLVELEDVARQRWNDLTRQARFSFLVSMSMSVGTFFVGVAIVVWGLVLVTRSNELSQQISGGILSALAALATTFSGRFWKDPVEHIQKFSSQQARLQAAFIGYMNRVAQLRLVFEHDYATDGITSEELEAYQRMLGEAMDQASQQLAA